MDKNGRKRKKERRDGGKDEERKEMKKTFAFEFNIQVVTYNSFQAADPF